MRCQIKSRSQLNPRPHHNSFSTVWRMQNLWSAVDRSRRNSHWRFRIIPSTNAVNLHTVMLGYISFHCLTAFSCSRTPQYACYTVTFRDIKLVTSPLDEWSVRHNHLYVTTLTTGRHQCPCGIRTRKPNNTLPTVHTLHRTANVTVQVTVCVQ